MSSLVNRYTVFFAVLPILSMYATPIAGITLGELFLLLFWVEYIVFSSKWKITLQKKHPQNLLLWFSVYALISSFISYCCGASNVDVVIRSVRFSFYYISAVVLGFKLINGEQADILFHKVSIFSIIFLLLQYAFYYLGGTVLRGVLPGFQLYLSDYDALNYEAMYAKFFRPTSIFLEPAHFCQYIFIPLAVALFKKNNIALGLLLTTALVFSTAAQGILIGAAIWFYYVYCKFKQKSISNKSILKGIVIIALTIPVFYALLQSRVFEESISRLFVVGKTSAVTARLGAYSLLFDDWDIFTLIFGHGFGNVMDDAWFPGLAYVLYGTGLVGTGLIALYLGKSWKAGSDFSRCMIIVFLLTFIQASVFMNVLVILYVYFIGAYKKR